MKQARTRIPPSRLSPRLLRVLAHMVDAKLAAEASQPAVSTAIVGRTSARARSDPHAGRQIPRPQA